MRTIITIEWDSKYVTEQEVKDMEALIRDSATDVFTFGTPLWVTVTSRTEIDEVVSC